MSLLLRAIVLISAVPLSLPLCANAHMEMRWPYAFRSKFDPAISDPETKNHYPLLSDGSNYPCMGFQDLPSSQLSKTTYIAGHKYNITLSGEAPHLGGSCQLSLSYDNGQTFKVIKSMIGGCPLKRDWDFTVPSDAPASESVILAWTWFNLIGRREMYMNCARVTIAEQSVQRYRRYQRKRQRSFSALPDQFVCNIDNGCKTIERREVEFPNPGPVVERSVDDVVPDLGPGFMLDWTTGHNPSATQTNNMTTSAPSTYSSGIDSNAATFYRSIAEGPATMTTYFNSAPLLTVSSRYTPSLSSSSSTPLMVNRRFLLASTDASSSTTSLASSSSSSFVSQTIITSSASITASSSISTSTTSTASRSTSSIISTSSSVTVARSITTFSTLITSTTSTFATTTISTTLTQSPSTASTSISTSTSTSTTSTSSMSSSVTSTTTSTLLTLSSSLTTSTSLRSSSVISAATSTTSTFVITTISTTLTQSPSTISTSTSTPTATLSLATSTSLIPLSVINAATSTTGTFATTTISTTLTQSPSTTSTSSSTTSTSSMSSSVISAAASTLLTSSTTVTTSTFTTITTSTTSTTSSATILPTTCTPGSFTCNSATTFSQCVPNGSGSGTHIFMGSVAAGTQCADGSIIRQNGGACTPDGLLQCNGETAFYICNQGGLINMGPVAPGTACRNGVIGFA